MDDDPFKWLVHMYSNDFNRRTEKGIAHTYAIDNVKKRECIEEVVHYFYWQRNCGLEGCRGDGRSRRSDLSHS